MFDYRGYGRSEGMPSVAPFLHPKSAEDQIRFLVEGLGGEELRRHVDDRTRRLYFDAARTIDSDYEMKRVYVSALKKGAVSPALLAGVLDAARSIESDYEAATLLIEAVRSHEIGAEVRKPFFAALDSVQSSYEKGRVLQALLRRGPLPDDAVADVLRATGTIESSHEAGQVLQLTARTQTISGPARDAYLKVADRLGNHEQTQALAALVRSERR